MVNFYRAANISARKQLVPAKDQNNRKLLVAKENSKLNIIQTMNTTQEMML
jgi:hypothetical protein